MRDKGMLKAGKLAFLDYLFKHRETPLTTADGETIHTDRETST
jgi:hypothetical protein